MDDDVSANLVARWQTGDEHAATELFRRYAERLVALARSRLSAKLVSQVDPEDVVQSAYRSFFADARVGRFDLRGGGKLWQLLVVITLHKLQDQAKRLTAQKRAISREQAFGSGVGTSALEAHIRTRQPTPLEAVALVEEVEQIMRCLEPLQRRMLELRLLGYTLEEIAAETGRTERTVRRLFDRVKEMLESRSNPPCPDP